MQRFVLFFALFGALACQGDTRAYFAQDVVDTKRDIAFAPPSTSPRQTLDLYLPRATNDFPVVVFVHGGYWVAQDKEYFKPLVGLYGNVGYALARKGIGAAVINYRLVPDVTFSEQLGDVLDAVKWTQDHIAEYHGDASRMVLMGHSAGGHMVSLAAFDPVRMQARGIRTDTIRGYVPLSPIFDLEDMAKNPPESDFNTRVTEPVFGTSLQEFSPKTYFNASVPPMFVVMGEQDEPYLVTQIPRSVDALKALGAPVSLRTLPNHSHADVALNIDTDSDLLTPEVVTFVREVTKP